MSAVLSATPTLPTLPTLPATAPVQDARPAADGRHALDSTALLQGRKAVTIVHNGAFYQLQATKLGKLILTK